MNDHPPSDRQYLVEEIARLKAELHRRDTAIEGAMAVLTLPRR